MAKKTEQVALKETKGTFTFIGHVTGINNENAYREGEIKQGKNEGREYRSLRFAVQTSPENKLFVELFGMEKDEAHIYKRPTKEEKAKGKKGTSKKIKFENRDGVFPDGYELLGTSLGLEFDDKGKRVYETLVEFDAVERIFEEIEEGESVSVRGNIVYSTFTDASGNKKKQVKYQMTGINRLKKEVDFEDAKFEETASFVQDIMFLDKEYDKATKKLTVFARIIQYGNKWMDTSFTLYPEKEKVTQVAQGFHKSAKFGDVVKTFGFCHDRAVVEEIEVKADKANIFGDGGVKPKGQQSFSGRMTELEITAVDPATYIQGLYKEDMFVKEDLVEEEPEAEEEDNDANPFGNAKKPDFASDDEDGNEIEDEDDLPF